MTSGGVRFNRGALFHLLKNRIYLGEIVHRAGVATGCHPAIVDPEVFDEVGRRLKANAVVHADRPLRSADLPLKGLLHDADGHRMSPSFGYGRGGKVYRYYVSAPLQQGRSAGVDRDAIRRIKAEAIHEVVQTGLRSLIKATDADLQALLSPVRRIDVLPNEVRISLQAVELTAGARVRLQADPLYPERLVMVLPVRCQLRGGRVDIVSPDGAIAAQAHRPDPVLIKALREAHRLAKRIGWDPATGALDDQHAPTLSSGYERKLVRLAFLAPDLQRRILEGRQRPGLTLAQLMATRFSTCGLEQRRMFGG